MTGGRLRVDVETDLPEGEVALELVDAAENEAWTPELDAELARRAADVEEGRYHTLEEILQLLRTAP